MPTIPQEIAGSTQTLTDNASIVQQFAQGSANLFIPVEGGTLRPLLYWQGTFQSKVEELSQPYVDQIVESIDTATDAASAASTSADNAAGSASAAASSASDAGDSATAAAGSASAADSHRQAAAGSASDAVNSASSASGSASAAADSESLAEKWAQEGEDVEVGPGLYSAYHWAQKAMATTDTSWSAITSKPDTATRWPTLSEVTDLQSALDDKAGTGSNSFSGQQDISVSSGSPAVDGYNSFQTTAGLTGVAGRTASAGNGYLGTFRGGVRAGVYGEEGSYSSDERYAGYFAGRVHMGRYSLSAASVTSMLDLAQHQVFRVDASSPRTLSFSNVPGSTRAMTAIVSITGNSAVTWPAGINWTGGAAPELGDSWTEIVLFWDGARWTGRLGGAA